MNPQRQFPIVVIAMATMICASSNMEAQAASALIARADSAYTAMNIQTAITYYNAAVNEEPKNTEALWKAARSKIEFGTYMSQTSQKLALFKDAEQQARLAVASDPGNADAHFALALALGHTALSEGLREKIKHADETRSEALACLAISPKHPGCLHTLGMWNAEVMRPCASDRLLAKIFPGGEELFTHASWEDAQRYLVAAVTYDPEHVTHRLELGRVYADRGMNAEARAQFQAVVKGMTRDYNDLHYKKEAARALQQL